MVDLLDYVMNEEIKKDAPLADRMRPRTLDEFVGQEHILSPGRLLRRAIQADQLSSVIFYGPPGTGKTTLARIIANTTKARFLALNAVLSGVKDIRACIDEAKKLRKDYQKRTILFIDEVHRFNKSQQDALLPHVENGTVILIGATTENPYFEVNKALVSRSRVFQLRHLGQSGLKEIISQALKDKDRGLGHLKARLDEDAVDHLVRVANGDARALLNALELAVVTSAPDEYGNIHIDISVAEESIQHKAVLYDKDGDAHFDTISAFIKSMRGSDPDAALYWMAKMVYAGEDPRFIFRRMIIFAAEDIGMADPNALKIVMTAAQAFDYVGMPEGRFHLAEACLYCSTAPKSNSGFAFFDALDSIRKEKDRDVPNHLKDANRDGEGLGHGKGYLYPHSYQEHWVAQQYLPKSLQGRLFYQPSDQGYESQIAEVVSKRREAQLAAALENSNELASPGEEFWRGRTMGDSSEILVQIRDHLFSLMEIPREAMILDINAGSGLLLGEALRRAPDGTVYALMENDEEKEIQENQYGSRDFLSCPIIQIGKLTELPMSFKEFKRQKISFDLVVSKGGLSKLGWNSDLLGQLRSILTESGGVLLAESLPDQGQRLSEYIPESSLDEDLRFRLRAAESAIFDPDTNPKVSWTRERINRRLGENCFTVTKSEKVPFKSKMLISNRQINQWFDVRNTGNQRGYASYLSNELDSNEIDKVRDILSGELAGKVVTWRTSWLFVYARKVEK